MPAPSDRHAPAALSAPPSAPRSIVPVNPMRSAAACACQILALLVLLPTCLPSRAGDDPAAGGGAIGALARQLDELVPRLLAEGKIPGAVIAVGRRSAAGGFEHWEKAYGVARFEPEPAPLRADAIFDLASISKPLAAGTSLMILVERGRVDLDDPVGKYLPEFAEGDKAGVTVRHLMTHMSGLPGYLPAATQKALRDAHGFPCVAETRAAVRTIALADPPGRVFRYSCLNAILCAEIVERVSGEELDRFAAAHIFGPLGMRDTGFIRLDAAGRPLLPDRAAAGAALASGAGAGASAGGAGAGASAAAAGLERYVYTTRAAHGVGADGFLCAQVHDPLAAMQAGVSGNAGVFSTAADLGRFAQMMLEGGALDGVRVLRPETLRAMTRVQNPGGVNATGRPTPRGLLWDVYPAPDDAGDEPPAFGHTGYTGGALRIYPGDGLYIIALTHRVHPDDSAKIEPFRRAIWRSVRAGLGIMPD